MSLSHQLKEEETLVAYFKQMLTESVDEDDNVRVPSFDTDIEDKSDLIDNSIHLKADNETVEKKQKEESFVIPTEKESKPDLEQAPFEMQLQVKEEVSVKPVATIEKPKQSLESLLKTVQTVAMEDTVEHVDVKTEVKVEEPKVLVQEKVETKVEAPKVQVEQIAPPVETKVEVAPKVVPKIVTPEVKVVTPVAKTEPIVKVETSQVVTNTTDIVHETQVEASVAHENKNVYEWKNIETEEEFQTLFFIVQGVRYAVPLIDLGAIIECKKVTQIFGKPSWYMGITDVRGRKLNIVDTLRWVVPTVNESPDKYPYLVSLSNSDWSLGCNELEGNRTISRDQVNWRKTAGTRPWLAGIVKKEMCALLHVDELIRLFKQGMDQKSILKKDLNNKK